MIALASTKTLAITRISLGYLHFVYVSDKDYLRIARMKITRANFAFNDVKHIRSYYSFRVNIPRENSCKIHAAIMVNIEVPFSHLKLFRRICARNSNTAHCFFLITSQQLIIRS